MTATAERPWVQEMIVVHRVFRRESGILPELVAACRPGDTGRAAPLAGLIREYVEGLHQHHTAEDELLWPKLLARLDLDAELVLRMEQQHDAVAAGLTEVDRRLAAWERGAGAAERGELVQALRRHREQLLFHLDEEERSVLPLVHEYITPDEWNELGEHARAHTPDERLLSVLGAVLEEATPAETARFLSLLPLPARLLWHTVGKRAYTRRMRKIRTI